MKNTLIYLASNRKGDELFKELSKRFDRKHYLFAGYGSLPFASRMVIRALTNTGLPLKDCPRLDYRFRVAIAARVRAEVDGIVKDTGIRQAQVICWHGLFPLTADWRRFGRLSAISDVPMTDAYFSHFRVNSQPARTMRLRLRETMLENCENFFTHSEWAAEANKALHPAYSDQICRIGWGSDMPLVSREEALRPRDSLQVLCVGNDYFRKGVDFYDQVAGRMKDRIPGLECLMVGEPGSSLPARKLRNLKVLGRLPRPELAALLRNASLFALFSRFEPAGHVTVEAMTYGVPVICSNEGGIAEPVVNALTGFVCPSFSIDFAVDKACSLLQDPFKLARFREQAYDHATGSWLWSHVADRIMRRLVCNGEEVFSR